MAGLREAVYTVPPIPCIDQLSHRENTTWSPETCALIFSPNEAFLIDTAITISQNKELI
jgi:hypothetical protein